MNRTKQRTIPLVIWSVQVNTLKLKANYAKPMVKIIEFNEQVSFHCRFSAQCRREFEDDGEMTEEDILRETANIRCVFFFSFRLR